MKGLGRRGLDKHRLASPRGSVWQNLVRGTRLAWVAGASGLIRVAALSALIAPLTIVPLWAGKRVVDLVTAARERHLTLIDLIPSAIVLGVAFAASRALLICRENEQEIFARKVDAFASHQFLAQAANVDLGHFEDPVWQDRIQRGKRDVSWRTIQLTTSTIELLTLSLSTVSVLGFLGNVHPVLVVLSIGSLVPWVIVQRRVNRRLYEFHIASATNERERWYVADLLSRPDLAKEIRAFGVGQLFLRKFSERTETMNTQLAALYRRSSLMALIAGAGTGIALA
jgi:ATP-binding cassette subfamily B protein